MHAPVDDLKAQGFVAGLGEFVVDPSIRGHFDAAVAAGPILRGRKEPAADAAVAQLPGDEVDQRSLKPPCRLSGADPVTAPGPTFSAEAAPTLKNLIAVIISSGRLRTCGCRDERNESRIKEEHMDLRLRTAYLTLAASILAAFAL